uniref:Lysine-specific histone demethylase 1 homolog 3 n=1 Tax=Solanum tuberosum TaxID=4113 RepID=M1DPC1_SOLTU
MNRGQGRTCSKQSLDQVSSGFLGNINEEPSALVSSSSSGKVSKTRVKSLDFSNRNVDSKVVRSKNSRRGGVSDEIICLNKEPTYVALVALTTGFPSDSLTDEEIEAGVDSNVDIFAHGVVDSSCLGEFFLFYNYATVASGPFLLVLVAGEAEHRF